MARIIDHGGNDMAIIIRPASNEERVVGRTIFLMAADVNASLFISLITVVT